MNRKSLLATAIAGALAVMSQSAVSQTYVGSPFGGNLYQGVSSSATPYVQGIAGYDITSILTVGDAGAQTTGYRMVGIPDGLGAYDNGNGTFTVLMNHELGNTQGTTRAHGGIGAFVSQWVIDKNTLQVISGQDLIRNVYGWNSTTQSSYTVANSVTGVAGGAAFSFNRFCSADLAPTTAYYNAATGLGSQERIFMHGEEGGANGYQMATVATGSSAGNSFVLGKFNLSTNGSGLSGVGGWENALANPYAQDKTIVIGNNDGGTGIMTNSVAVYVGTKQATGSEIEKAGLTNGTLKFVNVTGMATEGSTGRPATAAANNLPGNATSAAFTLSATSATSFLRPEDGAWSKDGSKFYFVTTDRYSQVKDGVGTQVGQSRLWRLSFADITNPDAGGTIDLLLDGSEAGQMYDNLTLNADGTLTLQEDVGNNAHNGKMWIYDPLTNSLKLVARSDPARFGNIGLAATSPFNADEESSGVIDITDVLGRADGKQYSMFVSQAHYAISGELVEGGQLLVAAVPEPETYAMMLAGLGLLGFAARRRQKNK